MAKTFQKSGGNGGKVALGILGIAAFFFLPLPFGRGGSSGGIVSLPVRVSASSITVGTQSFAGVDSALDSARGSGARLFELSATGDAISGTVQRMLAGLRQFSVVVEKG